MSSSPNNAGYTAPENLCELLLRDVASLLVTSESVKRALVALRPECASSEMLSKILDTVVVLCDGGEPYLRKPLLDSGAVLPTLPESAASAVVTEFIGSIPVKVSPAVLATEVVANLRLLVQYIELKALLAAEAAVLVGQTFLSSALLKWSAEWRNCGRILRTATVQVRAKAYVADLEIPPSTQPA